MLRQARQVDGRDPLTESGEGVPDRGDASTDAGAGTEGKEPWSRRLGFWLAAVLVAAAFVDAYWVAVWDIDFWWHAALGRHLLESGTLPVADPLGVYGSEGLEARFQHRYAWLSQLILAVLLQQGGPDLVVGARSLLLGACLGIVGLRSRGLGASPGIALSAAAVAGLSTLGYTGDRPNLATYLWLPIVIALWRRLALGGDWRWGAGLVAAAAIWANCHAGAALGGVLLLAGLAGRLFETGRRGWSDAPNRRLMGWTAAAVAATMASPLGWDGYRMAFALQGNSELLARTSEYAAPWSLPAFGGWKLAGYWILLIASFAVGGVAIARRRLTDAALLLPLAGLSLTAARYVPLLVFLATPWVLAALPTRITPPSRGIVGLLALVSAGWLGVAAYKGDLYRGGVSERFPVEAVEYLRSQGAAGRVLNHLDWGGYLLWYGEERLRPFIDGRTLLAWKEQVFHRYTHALWVTPVGRQVLEREGFEFVMVPRANPRTGERYPLPDHLVSHSGWRLVHEDELAVVFERTDP